jgi:hypothetical protein
MHHQFEYAGGLGDIIVALQGSGTFDILEEMGAGDSAEVHLMTFNPHVRELFDHHPKKSQITVFDRGWMSCWPEERLRRWRLVRGLPAIKRPKSRNRLAKRPIRFIPADIDRHLIEPFEGQRYIVISATASQMLRSFPLHYPKMLTEKCLERNFTPIFIGRNFQMTQRRPYGFERQTIPRRERKAAKGSVSMIDKLTVPTTAALIQGAKAVISCHSAVKIIAILSSLPLLLLYPDNVLERLRTGKVLHTWVETSPFCTHTDYDNENLQEIISTFFEGID